MKFWRWHKRCHHPRHPLISAAAVRLAIDSVVINLRYKTMQVNLTWTTPALRKDGTTALALSEISQTNVLRNGTVIGSPQAAVGAMAFSDTSPLTGDDEYLVETVTTDGFVSDPSNAVSIQVAAANPAAAVSDLAGTLITP